jgi:hypothetical protein
MRCFAARTVAFRLIGTGARLFGAREELSDGCETDCVEASARSVSSTHSERVSGAVRLPQMRQKPR